MHAVPIALGLTLLCASWEASAQSACAVRSGATAVPLIELYTSEGCSSCPPADRWFSRKVSDTAVNGLAFHVDYWDDIGWPDRFASPTFTARQRARVASTGGNTVYTPQVMVGSQVRAQWRAGRRFDTILQQARQPAAVGLALQLQPHVRGWMLRLGAARADDIDRQPAQVWLAQYIDGQVTQVRAGENRGVTLHHDRVVRRLWGPWPLAATPMAQALTLAPDFTQGGVTAFVQTEDGRILQSLGLAAARCDAVPPKLRSG